MSITQLKRLLISSRKPTQNKLLLVCAAVL